MTGKRRLVFVAVLGIAALALSAGMVSAAGDTEVSVEPGEDNVSVNSTQTFEVVVENATDDIEGYEFNVSLSNANAEITGASALGGPDAFNANVSEDGSTVAVDAIWTTDGEVFASDSPAILTVEVEGAAVGQTELNTDLASASGPYNQLLAGPGDEYTVTASNAASITVEEPSEEFEVSNLDAPRAAEQGDDVTATATITNAGGAEGTQTVEFRVDGATVASEEVTLAAGAEQTVSLTASTENLSVGTYTHGIFTADDSQTAEIQLVENLTVPTLPGGQGPPTDTTGDGLLDDVNGDGEFSLIDVAVLFENRDDDTVANNTAQFDFNGNGEFSLVDIASLFQDL